MIEFLDNPLILAAGVFLLGGLGAVLRVILQRAYPFGLLFANLIGSFLLGILVGWTLIDINHPVMIVIGVGFCGGLTTFSTLAVLWAKHADQRQWARLGWAIRRHLFSGLIAAAAGLLIGSWLPA